MLISVNNDKLCKEGGYGGKIVSGKIKKVTAREVFNTKGLPTIEVDLLLEDGTRGRAASPGGTSRGKQEAIDLLDGDITYFQGLGVKIAIEKVNEINQALRGKDAYDQALIDDLLIKLDGTENKSALGGNTIIATSIACAKAASSSKKIDLFKHLGDGTEIPIPFVYVMFAGPAYVGEDGVCDFQEYALIPLKAKNYKEGYLSTLGIYKKLCSITSKRSGYGPAHYTKIAGIPVPRFESNEEVFEILTDLIKSEGLTPWEDMGIHTDVAANQLYRDGKYYLKADHKVFSRDEMINWLKEICIKYPIVSLEDPLYEEDWKGWQILTKSLGKKIQVLGDDIFVTNKKRLSEGINKGVANAIVIKPNQIGTLTETIETIKMAKSAGYGTVISPRSGEIWDPYIAHLCVAQNLAQGKIAGAYSSGENNVNEMIRIADILGKNAIFRDGRIFPFYR